MSLVPIIMPQLGESIAEATILNFLRQPTEVVLADQNVLEVETDKAVMNVTSPCAGILQSWSVQTQKSYPVGAVLGYLESDSKDAALIARPGSGHRLPSTPQSGIKDSSAQPMSPSHSISEVRPSRSGLPVPAQATGASYLSPRVKARMLDLGLNSADMAAVAGGGSGGRVTVQDFERFLASLEGKPSTEASSMRIAVADAMRRSWSRPLASAGLDVNMEPIWAHRQSHAQKPGPALYVLRALGIALGENPAVAGRLIGAKIVHPTAVDLGVAVEVTDGVLVPVLRTVDQRRLDDLLSEYQTLVQGARHRRIPLEATGGSIATISNYGNFGLRWATPIPLPEQSLVIGLGTVRKVPAWDEVRGTFLPQREGMLTVSFDHRVTDGGAVGRLLMRIAELLQQPAAL